MEVYRQIQKNENMLIFLDEIKPYLKEVFPYDLYSINVVNDPEIVDFTQIEVIVYVSNHHFYNGVVGDINFLRDKIRPLRRKLNIFSEFSVTAGVLHV